MNWKPISVCSLAMVGALGVVIALKPSLAAGLLQRAKGKHTVKERLAEFGTAARHRLNAYFGEAGITYPPRSVVLVALKQEKRLELHASLASGEKKFVRAWPILAASGKLGPKLRQGDSQVPEGVYSIESLNPNSLFHVSLRVGYPNAFDRRMAAAEGRTELGGDIMIHGKAASIGCLAMGDVAAEELFSLAADVGLPNVQLLITPIDFRSQSEFSGLASLPPWTEELYRTIRAELSRLPPAKAR